MNSAQNIVELLNLLVKDKGISINKMLIECDLNKSTVDNMKRGQMPSADKLAKIANYLGVTTDYLLGISDMKEPNRPYNSNAHKVYISDKENEMLIAYRNNVAIQEVINKILDI